MKKKIKKINTAKLKPWVECGGRPEPLRPSSYGISSESHERDCKEHFNLGIFLGSMGLICISLFGYIFYLIVHEIAINACTK